MVTNTFDGDHTFIKSFHDNVGKICTNADTKPTRLLQYVSPRVRESLSGSQLTGGQAGYDSALDNLESRYGDAHLVTETILANLKSGKSLRSADEIRQLADDLKNASLVLKQLKTYNEINTQSVMNEIISRIPSLMQNKWRSRALKIKRESGAYPRFVKLITNLMI